MDFLEKLVELYINNQVNERVKEMANMFADALEDIYNKHKDKFDTETRNMLYLKAQYIRRKIAEEHAQDIRV